jgi:hypothetical protein
MKLLTRLAAGFVLLGLLLLPLLTVRGEETPKSARDVETRLASAEENRAGALHVAQEQYRKARIAAQKAYLKELSAALKLAMEAYDLDGANAIDRARKAAQWELAQLEDPGKAPRVSPAEIAGTYTVRHRDWQGDVVLRADGRMGRPSWGEKHRDEGTWSYEAGVLTLHWKGWGAETFTVASCFASEIAAMVRVEAE